jgi:DNA-binding NarL/FixJ family response regulator
VLVDDNRIVREGLACLLAAEPDLTIVGEAADGDEAIDMVRRVRPDIVVMDINMPRLDGIEATRRIASEMPFIRVIGFSMHNAEEIELRIREAGAVAFLVKSGPPEALVEAIRASVSGDGRVRD